MIGTGKKGEIMKAQMKKAAVEDAKSVADLAIQMWSSHTIEELAEEFRVCINTDSCVVFLALLDVEAIGFAQCGLRHDYVEGTDTSPVGYLEGIYVKEECLKKQTESYVFPGSYR